ncbi:hypothetical protein GE253_03050 [Niveispirillum sp. SYP-B3756]|uniref:hypothetical protein n=1 Tax=Niveispirillum sp. SYP-B3756 TaxID=2662178 RepID=UPI001292A16C|nr:hypothetical protein [Niveispirillum sp. SYP-B3756]MQP64314.1 hypothetical protein [Niveispirillum sp. SYP-B3756]
MSERELAATGRATGGAGEEPSTSTHFLFQSKVFSLPGGYFTLHEHTEPVFAVHLGDVWGKIPFRTLRESFYIDDRSEDARLLGVVEKGLKYVKEIRPGDSIPRELLDGTASWRVEERHLTIARGRLTLQLVSWISGKEEMVSDPYELEKIVEDPQTKVRVQEAFSKLAKQFGLPEERKQEIVDKVDNLAREMSYIEALRERYSHIQKMMVKLAQSKRIFRTDQQLTNDIARMVALAKQPLGHFDDLFNQVDSQTAEVMAMLSTFDAQVTFIRHMRDELHTLLMLWDEMIDMWNGHDPERDTETENRLKRTYQFLAKNFLISKVWQRGS